MSEVPSQQREVKGSVAAVADALLDVVQLTAHTLGTELRRLPKRTQGAIIEPSQLTTLRRIARRPCTMTDLARFKSVSLPTISKSVELFVRDGLVERWIDATDRRQTLVRLTPKGRRTLEGCRTAAVTIVTDKLRELPPADRLAINQALQTLAEALGLSELFIDKGEGAVRRGRVSRPGQK